MNLRNIIASVMVVSSTSCLLSIPANASEQPKQAWTIEGKRLALPYMLVGYSDLNLRDAKGVDRLQQRIRQASKELCISEGRLPLDLIRQERQCYYESIAYTAPQVADAIKNFNSREMASLKPIEVAWKK